MSKRYYNCFNNSFWNRTLTTLITYHPDNITDRTFNSAKEIVEQG